MSKGRKDRGAAAVEFALVVPLLLLLVIGIMEFGRAYGTYTELTSAARDAVRVMAIHGDPALARTTAKNAVSTLALTDGEIAVTPTTCVATATDPAPLTTVTITHELDTLTGFFGATFTLTGEGTMRCNG